MFAKAIVGWARYKRGAKISRSKQKSKKNFAMYRMYVTSTGMNGDAVQRRSGETSLETWLTRGPWQARVHTDFGLDKRIMGLVDFLL
jgi:hypothetical protein